MRTTATPALLRSRPGHTAPLPSATSSSSWRASRRTRPQRRTSGRTARTAGSRDERERGRTAEASSRTTLKSGSGRRLSSSAQEADGQGRRGRGGRGGRGRRPAAGRTTTRPASKRDRRVTASPSPPRKPAVVVASAPAIRLTVAPTPPFPSSASLHLVRLPNVIGVATAAFSPDSYVEQADDDGEDEAAGGEERKEKEKKKAVSLMVENVMRWREVREEDGRVRRESNTRWVRWSDGTSSLLIGRECFDAVVSQQDPHRHYLFLRHQGRKASSRARGRGRGGGRGRRRGRHARRGGGASRGRGRAAAPCRSSAAWAPSWVT